MMFEYEKALERFMGEKEILLEVLPSYLESLETSVNEIKGLDPVTQCSRIRELAHSIKGSSLNLDIVTLGREAESLEDLAHDIVVDKIPASIKKLVAYAAETKRELESYLD